ncbi:MAG TPA: hypothetical protein VLH10_01545 [Yinghuangia sp.]|nr:hypothetical protein [Yinghuangia sp.]
MRRYADPHPHDDRNSRGPDQPDSFQGSTRLGDCTAPSVPVEFLTSETSSGPGHGQWVCCPCYRART